MASGVVTMEPECWPDGALAKHMAEAPPQGWTAWEWQTFCQALARGLSYAKAGELVAKGKNVCIGVAHRRRLPTRESWIGRGFGAHDKAPIEAKARDARKAQAAALIEAAAAKRQMDAAQVAERIAAQAAARAEAEAKRIADRQAAMDRRLAASMPRLRRSEQGCQWPSGTPGQDDFRFCAAPDVVVGRPYCPAHCARAYTRTVEEVQRAAEVARQVIGTAAHRPFTVAARAA